MSEKLASLGGPPVRTAAWPRWPLFTSKDIADVTAILNDGRLTAITGPTVKSFEEKFAAKFGVKYALATCNGVTALHLALAALGIGPGDEVIIPAHTFIGSAIPVLMANAIPVFVDVDIDMFTIDVGKIEAAITDRTRAIVPVHLNGLAAEMDTILALARTHKLFVVEDACQSHGGTYKGRLTGTLGEMGCFSFFEDKVITTGKGGMLITDDPQLYEKGRCIRSYGEELVTTIGERTYEHVTLGFNYRMGSMNAAYLREHLADVEGIIPPKEVPGCLHAYYKFVCRIDRSVPDVDALGMVEAIKAEGVAATPRYPLPLPLQKVFREKLGYGRTDCPYSCHMYGGEPAFLTGSWPVAQRVGEEAFVLLVHPSIGENDLDDAVRAVRKVAAHYRR